MPADGSPESGRSLPATILSKIFDSSSTVSLRSAPARTGKHKLTGFVEERLFGNRGYMEGALGSWREALLRGTGVHGRKVSKLNEVSLKKD